jgi:hypothetical protein
MWRCRKTPYYRNITRLLPLHFVPCYLAAYTPSPDATWHVRVYGDTILTGHDIFAECDSLNDPYE